MCGIAGFLDFGGGVQNKTRVLDEMTTQLTRRGPDSAGTWVNDVAALGHRRLVVVDPLGGAQPMSVSLGQDTYTLIYNGELYNTAELRTELIELGHNFYTHSDTEVLLKSYVQWGSSCVSKFNGIFAFAVWEEPKQRLFLARDRMGVKPLFYKIIGEQIIFASEIKALLKHPDVEPVIDSEGLTHLFALSPARVMRKTPFRGIEEVGAGECLIFSKMGVYTHTYWQFYLKEHTEDAEKTAEHLRFLVTDAIKRQLVSDVPVGTFLSGGLDSSAISSVAAYEYKKQNKTLKTFSIDYADNDLFFKQSIFQPDSDAHYIKVMAENIGSQHYNYVCGIEELTQALERSVEARDLPGMADVDSSLLLFCEKIKEHVTVALSGECADELFGGYPWFHREEMLHAQTFPWSDSLKLRREMLNEDFAHLAIEDFARQSFADCIAQAPLDLSAPESEKHFKRILYTNVKYFMANLLCRKDTMSMYSGLEVRVPYADHRIAEYAYNIPRDIMCYENREKGILRKALAGILPDEILYRKKSPYPKTHNPKYTQIVKKQLEMIINDKNNKITQIVNPKFLQELLCFEKIKDMKPFFGQLMSGPQLIAYLVSLEYWLKNYNVIIKN